MQNVQTPDIANKDLSLLAICDLFKINTSCMHYSYFSIVCLSYIKRLFRTNKFTVENLSRLLKFLQEHKSVDTNKKSFILLIEIGSYYNLKIMKDILKKYAFELIGDPADHFKWAPWKGATQLEIDSLKKTQRIINSWITEEFIEVFFAKISMDDVRREFWEQYIDKIDSIKICGPETLKYKLSMDERLKSILPQRYLLGNSGHRSALIMYMKDHVLIEFCQTGNAFYGYLSSNKRINDLLNHSWRISIDSLKQPQIQNLRYFSTAKEGKVLHTSRWERTIENWLEDVVGV